MNRRLTQDEVDYIRENYRMGSHDANLFTFAKMFDVSVNAVYCALKGRTRREYAQAPPPPDSRRVFKRGEFIPMEFLIENEAGKLVLDGDKARFE